MAIKSVKFPGQYEPEAYAEVERFNSHSANYLTVKGEDGGSPKSVDISDAHAHALANWILENVPKPDPLPKESGVYVPKNVGLHEGPVVYVNYKGSWRSMPEVSDAEGTARIWAESTGLVRLSKIEEN